MINIDQIMHLCPFIFFLASHCFHILGILQKSKGDILSVLKAERDELESSLGKERLHTLQLKQELADAECSNSDLYKVTTFTVEIHFFILDLVWNGSKNRTLERQTNNF